MTAGNPAGVLIELGDPVTARRHDPLEAHLRAALDLRLRAVVRHDPGTRSGADPEDLHQMRVAVRRMRAMVRAARPLLDRAWADLLRAELGWLGGVLGPVRDLDVLLADLGRTVAGFDATLRPDAAVLCDALRRERAAARERMLAALDGDRYLAVLHLVADTAVWPVAPAASGVDPAVLGIRLVRAEFERLARAVRAAGQRPSDPVLHDLRVRGKRLRYVAELAEPAIALPEIAALLAATKAMQDVLGEHQDACVAMLRVRASLADLGPAVGRGVTEVADRILEHDQLRRTHALARWPHAWTSVHHAGEAIPRL